MSADAVPVPTRMRRSRAAEREDMLDWRRGETEVPQQKALTAFELMPV